TKVRRDPSILSAAPATTSDLVRRELRLSGRPSRATGDRAAYRFAAYGAEDLLETLLQLLADGQRGAQVHPHPRVDRVRPVRGEADGQQEVSGYDAVAGAP